MPARPRTHVRGCRCPLCDRRARAAAEAAALQAAALAKVQPTIVDRKKANLDAKIKETARVVGADIREADRQAARMREAERRAADDPKAARLRELRAEGKTLAEAIEIIESEGSEDAG